MEMHQVRYFLAVCRTLNFTKAADECYVAQPSLTRAIQKLEEELGGPLFHRERANTHLTDLGRAMQPLLERTYSAAQSAKDLANAYKKGEIARLRMSLADSIPLAAMGEVLDGVHKSVPNVEIEAGVGADPSLVNAIADGNLDLIILRDCVDAPDKLRSWQLYEEMFRVLLPETHRLAAKEQLMLADLAGETFILRTNCPVAGVFQEECTRAGVAITFRHQAQSEDQLHTLVRLGMGLGLVPETAQAIPGLITRTLCDQPLSASVSLCAVAGRRFSAPVDAFVKLARARDWTPLGKPEAGTGATRTASHDQI